MEKETLISWVTAAQNGNENALNSLFSATYEDIYYFALKTIKNPDLASDITQETYITIFKSIKGLNDPAAFLPWSRRIAYRHCLQYFDKKQDVLVDEDEDGNTIFDTLADDDKDFIPHEALDKDDFKKTVLAIIDTLSEEQRSAVLMYYFEELSVSEIAEIQGVSEGTIKSRLNYARKAIKAAVEDYENKNNIKLHSFGLLPLLGWVFSADKAVTTPPVGLTAAISAATSGAAAATVSATATAAATSNTATAFASTAVKASASLGVKIASIAAAVSVAIVGGTAAIIISQNDDKASSQIEESDDDGKNNAGENNPSTPDFSTPDKDGYESDTLIPYQIQADMKDEFIGFADKNAKIIVTKDSGGLLHFYFLEDGSPTNAPANVVDYGYNEHEFYYKDNTGTYHFVDKNGNTISCSQITGEPINWGKESLGSSYLLITKDENNSLFYTTFNSDGTAEHENEPLVIFDQKNSKSYNSADKIICSEGDYHRIYIEVNGTLLTRDNVFLWHLSEPSQFYSYSVLENYDKIIAYGYDYSNTTPLYSLKDDQNHIYYNYTGNSNDVVPINLPDGYTVSNIKKAVFADTTVIMFNDGSVYHCKLTHDNKGINLIKNDELSNLGKGGKIKDIYASHHQDIECDIRVLMDDNVLYKAILTPEE